MVDILISRMERRLTRQEQDRVESFCPHDLIDAARLTARYP